MAIMYLSKYELLTLSTYSRIKPDKISPLTRLYMDQALGMDSEKLQEAANEMLNNNYIQKQGERILLAKELEPAFFILHKPERVIAFKRLSMADINEIYFASKGGFSVQYTVRYDGLFETLVYPFTIETIKKWYEEELMKGIEFSEDSMQEMDVQLTLDETILLFAVINIYRRKVLNISRALEPDETWISIDNIKSFKYESEIKGLIAMLMTQENIESYLANNPNLETNIDSLVSKGFLLKSQKGISYSDMAKNLFDPGNVVDGIIIKDYAGGKGFLSSINVLKTGYMLFTPHTNGVDYRIKTIDKTIDKKELLSMVLESGDKVNKDLPKEDNKKLQFCAQCGNALPEGAAFCQNCGSKA